MGFPHAVTGKEGRVQMDPVKTQAIRDWASPRSVKEVQRFSGICQFLQEVHQELWHCS